MNSNKLSHYDQIAKQRKKLSSRIVILNSLVSLIITIYSIRNLPIDNIFILWILPLVLFFASYALTHMVCKKISKKYVDNWRIIKEIDSEIIDLRNEVEKIYSIYPQRSKGQQFKSAFQLKGKTLENLEETLAVGMFKEKREVFVTAFMKKNKAVRVTATIGSANRCHNSDDINKWPYYLEKMKCDEIRQYHNHPTTSNKTEPSGMDFFSSKNIVEKFQKKTAFKSFIIYWNQIKEWRIIQYDHEKNFSVVKVFDIKNLGSSPD